MLPQFDNTGIRMGSGLPHEDFAWFVRSLGRALPLRAARDVPAGHAGVAGLDSAAHRGQARKAREEGDQGRRGGVAPCGLLATSCVGPENVSEHLVPATGPLRRGGLRCRRVGSPWMHGNHGSAARR